MINSIVKALDILSLFSPIQPRMGLAMISHKMNLPKSTVHNLLSTLVSRGFIERVDNDQYALGTAVIVLAQASMARVVETLVPVDQCVPILASPGIAVEYLATVL